MNFDGERRIGWSQKKSTFCCTKRRDLLKNDNFEKTIDIFPRIIVFKKLKLSEVYSQMITIRNTGTFCRRIKFISEPNNDIILKINGNTNLQPGSHVSVDVFLEPTKKTLVNQHRCIFVIAEHPDIVWEIPLIVLKKEHEIHVPEIICLPKVPANTVSNYQFLVYNPQDNEVVFSICSNHEGLTLKPYFGTIPANDLFKILVVGKVPPEPITTSIMLSLKNGKSFKILVQMEVSNQLIHLSTSKLIFKDTYVGLKSLQKLCICNRSNECVNFQWTNNETVKYLETDDKSDEELIVSEFITIENKWGYIPPMNSVLTILNFTPPENFHYNEEESQLQINEVVHLFCPAIGPQSYRVHISGRILGADIEILPKEIDIGNIYMGQIYCVTFEVLNKGPIVGVIYFKDHTDQKEMNCSVIPSSIDIEPDEKKTIELSFYRRDVGKFLTKLNFKIKSGDFVAVLLRGISLPTIVKVFPDVFEFNNIPICIPQKGSVAIFNPLPVSVVVEPKIVDDGVENPLILCLDSLNLPLNTRTPTYYNSNGQFEEEDLNNCSSDFSSNKEESSRTNISSQISFLFQNNVLDDIPSMATELLQDLKLIRSEDQLVTGMKIIDASLNCIFDRCDYFQELRDNRNYLRLNWKDLPCDAKEVAIEEEHFYLEPDKSKSFPFVLVPNSTGPSTKAIQFKVYPLGVNNTDIKDNINSTYMISTLRLQYNCIIPILEYNNNISFSQPVYVDMENTFNMNFKNIDIVPGFVYFQVIPASSSGIIKVNKNKQKFCIGPGEKIEVGCSAIFRKIGNIILHGIFKLVGKLLDYSFKIEAHVLAPEIQISTEKIFSKQVVLEFTRTKIFITNSSPTNAQITFSLKNEKYQFLEPQGCSLAPNQKILISVFSKFHDPGLYKNVLYINLKHSEIQSIPIKFSVEGAPLDFEPNIKHGLDFGTLFKSNKIQDHIIKIKNLGEKSYKINFQNKISKKLTILPIYVFNIEPNILTLAANAQETVKIQLDTSKTGESEEEFLVDGIDDGKHRFKLFSFAARCTVIESKVIWSKNEVRFESKNPEISGEEKSYEIVSLINTTSFVANVNLNVQGFFILGENLTSLTEKSLEFSIKGKSSKEIYVRLNEKEIEKPNLLCQCFRGLIRCKVNNKTQKPLPLHVKTISPGLRICTPQVTMFPPYTDSFAHINIHNCSTINATFIWREIKSIVFNEPLSELYVEQLFSKTISEHILSMPKDIVPKFPSSIKPQCSEENNFESDQESSDEEIAYERESSVLDAVTVDLRREPSFSGSKTESSINSYSSLISLSSERTSVFHPKTCKPLPLSKIEVQNFGIDEIFKCLGFLEKTSMEPIRNFSLDNELTKCDKNLKKKDDVEDIHKIAFQHKSGEIAPKSMSKAYIFLPTLPEGKTLVSKYNLEVIGGQTKVLDLTVTSQKGRIQVSRTDIDLGKNIWYKIISEKIKITSISQYAIKITIVEQAKFTEKNKKLTDGHIEIISQKQFILMPKTSTDIELNVLLGLRQNFSESIGLEINNNTTSIPIHFRGSGVFPMIIPIQMNRIAQSSIDIMESYFHLRDLFNDIQRKNYQVKEITGEDVSTRSVVRKEKGKIYESTRTKRNETRTFVLINYSEEKYPKAEDIARVIETEKFVFHLFKSNELRTSFENFYTKCMHLRAMEFDPVINLKFTICRPIPWECCAISLDMDAVQFNETKNVDVEIVFLGPGRLFLSLRTQIAIPGLAASFAVSQKNGQSSSFIFYYQSTDDKTTKIYKNIHERSSDTKKNHNQDTKVNMVHSHSYDFDEAGVHQRKRNLNEIKQIKVRYTKMSQSMKENKNPLILTEICQTTDEDLSDLTLKLNLKLTVTKEFYEINQIIEDYLFIDIHLGPTVPILLKGKIPPE